MRLTVIFLLFTIALRSQIDSALAIPIAGIHFGGHFPLGDMGERFGPNLSAGGTFMYKTKKNWLIGVEANYLFGRNVKDDVLAQMRSSTGVVIDNDGFPGDLRITERGLTCHVYFGRVFRFLSSNPNSGLMVTVGGGYMQHKIHLYDANQRIAAIKGDLKYGYDRLSNGLATSQFIGYLFLSENRLLNFYFGVDAYQGYTTSVRKMNYDTGLPDTEKRLDLLVGLRFGWVLPLYKRSDQYYTN